MKGQKVLKQMIYHGSTKSFINTATLTEGLYTITFEDGEQKASYQIAIKH